MRNTILPAVLLIGALALTGCDVIGGDDEVHPTGDVLMWLNLGSTWSYRTADGGSFGLEAKYTIFQDGVSATIVDDTESDSLGTKSAFWIGEEGLYTAEYHAGDDDLDPPTVLFRFPAEEGTTYTSHGKQVRVVHEKIKVPAGTFAVYTYVVKSEVEGTIRWSFAPNIGIVRVINGDEFHIELTSYDLTLIFFQQGR